MTTKTNTEAAPVAWTREMIYRNPERTFQSMPPHDTSYLFTRAFSAALARETGWDEMNARPTIPLELRETVARRDEPCPNCTGRGLEVLCRGKNTLIEMFRNVNCDCLPLIRFWKEWGQIPSRFRSASLDRLAPYAGLALSENRQAVIIAAVRAAPTDSFLLIGQPNTGKTHLMTCLYRYALSRSIERQIANADLRKSVWRVNATALMNQTVEWSLQQGKALKDWEKEPVVTLNKIALAVKHGYKPCLFLDELDKIAITDFKLSGVCDIIDRVYEAEGQVVATMNKSAEELAAKWGANEAGTILRRIGVGPRAHTVLFVG